MRTLAVLLAVISLCIALAMSAAPTLSSSRPGAIVAQINTPLINPIVDPDRHLIYGINGGAIEVLNESTNHVSTLISLGDTVQIQFLALDPGSDRLLAEGIRVDGATQDNQVLVTTGLAWVVDAASSRIISTVALTGTNLDEALFDHGLTAVDPSLHHGLAVDLAGQGVLFDMTSGAVLATVHMNEPGSYLSERRDDALDARTHRLFVGVNQPYGLDMLDTGTGRVLRHIPLAPSLAMAVGVDAGINRAYAVSRRQISMLNARSGRVLRTLRRSGSNLVVDSRTHRLFVLDWGGTTVRVLDGRTLRLIRTVRLKATGGPSFWPILAVDPGLGRIFIRGSAAGRLTVLDGRSGRSHGTIRLHNDASRGVAVDSAAHRLYVSGGRETMVLDTRELG